MLEINMQND